MAFRIKFIIRYFIKKFEKYLYRNQSGNGVSIDQPRKYNTLGRSTARSHSRSRELLNGTSSNHSHDTYGTLVGQNVVDRKSNGKHEPKAQLPRRPRSTDRIFDDVRIEYIFRFCFKINFF